MKFQHRLKRLERAASAAKPVHEGVTFWLPYQAGRGGPAPGHCSLPGGATMIIYEPDEPSIPVQEISDASSPEAESLATPG
jgi:hypothetical protein